MAGIPSSSMAQQPPCMYNDPSVYVKTEYDQGKLLKKREPLTLFLLDFSVFYSIVESFEYFDDFGYREVIGSCHLCAEI